MRRSRRFPPRVIPIMFLLALITAGGSLAEGQSTNPSSSTTSAMTPQGMQPGSPAGSYAPSGFDNVNLFNGNLNLRLPLLTIGGRGSAGYTMTLATSTKKWQVKTDLAHEGDSPLCVPYQAFDFVGYQIYPYVCRHNLDVDRFTPIWKTWNTAAVGYSPGVLQGRKAGVATTIRKTCDTCPILCNRVSPMYRYTLTRLTFITPDGSEIELRDEISGGKPQLVDHDRCNDGSSLGAFRGRRFVSADGSGMLFVADEAEPIYDDVRIPTDAVGARVFSPSGMLYMRDGTSYRIDFGTVSWIRDRNGNKVTFNYGTTTEITDSLNRKITIEYDQTEEPYGLHDRITYHGFSGAIRIIRVSKTTLSSALRAPYTIRTFAQLFPELNGSQDLFSSIDPPNQDFNPRVISAVWLPDGRKYEISYNSYAEVARVKLPTGGSMEYDMVDGSGVIISSGATYTGVEERQIYRRLRESRVYLGGDDNPLVSKTVYTLASPVEGNWVKVEQFDGGSHLLALTKHYFNSSAAESLFTREPGELYSPDGEGREVATEALDTETQTTVLQRVNYTWMRRAPTPWEGQLEDVWPNHPPSGLSVQPENDDRLIDTVATIEPAGANLVKRTTAISPYDQSVGFDQYNNPTDVWEYDFGIGTTPGTLIRHTHTNYLADPAYTGENSPHLISLPTQTSIFDGFGIERARTSLEYDNYVPDMNYRHAFLTPRTYISGLDSSYSADFAQRGNVTAIKQWFLDTTGSETGSISTYAQYDIAGNVGKVIDARGYQTQFDYHDNFGSPDGVAEYNGEPANTPPTDLAGLSSFAFPTKVTNAQGHVSYAQFDYYLGRPIDGEDANGVVASGYYDVNDPLDRPKQVILAANQSLSIKSQTTFAYDDVANVITTTTDQTAYNDNALKSQIVYDGLGRTKESRQYETDTSYITVETKYDGLGRANQVSNPYRPLAPYSETPVWTVTLFDPLGRVLSVTSPDSSMVATSYSGNTVTVTDQAGKVRRSITDGLGRLRRVDEPDLNGNLGSVITPNQPTSYSYDALDNLTGVVQDIQTRTFVYDSLKRLLSASNPESGSVSYKYDENGNLTVKTDARGVSAHYEYDALNRIKRRWYNSSNSPTATTHNSPPLSTEVGTSDEIKYFYDSESLPGGAPSTPEFNRGFATGRLVAVTYAGGSNGDYYGYDVLGRIKPKIQRTGNVNYKVDPVYNAAGAITLLTYPSHRTISNTYDGAGRLSSFTGYLGDGTPRTYATGISYSPFGGMTQEQFGTTTTPVYNKRRYNARGQLWDIRASTVPVATDPANGDRGAIVNYYSNNFVQGGSGIDNNGNLLRQEIYVPSTGFFQDNFTYDQLNRLTSVAEKVNGSGSESFKQAYSYDRWGNRRIDNAATSGTGINNAQSWIDPANNRLFAPSDQNVSNLEQRLIRYDAAGNQKADYYSAGWQGTRTYDAENRMTTATDTANNTSTYVYDGNGRRIKRIVGGTETWQVYGLGGELLAEYPANTAAGSPQKEYGYRNGELLVTADPGNPLIPVFSDDFNDNSIDASKWTVYYPQGTPSIAEQNQQLQFTLSPNTAGYNGVQSTSTYDLTGRAFQVEVSQAVGQGGWAENMIEAVLDGNNYFLIDVGSSSMIFRNMSGGVNDQTVISYDPSSMRFWRIRHEQSTNTIKLETSADSSVWTTRKSFAVSFSIAALRFHFVAGAWGTGNGAPGVARYDNVQLVTPLSTTSISVPNSGFEAPSVGAGNLQYGPTGGSWTFYAAGVSGNGSGFGSTAPEGSQVAFLQGGPGSYISQSISGFEANTNYTITFSAAQRSNCCNSGGQDFKVYLDDNLIGTFHPTSGSFADYTTSVFTTTAAAHTLKFYGTNPLGGDHTAFIDNVRISGTSAPGEGVRWLVTDQLGTPRMVFDQTGSLANISRHDYLPFGEDVPANFRTGIGGFATGDNVRQKFTQKERDNETGLDYFVARYYASAQGRFTSADEFPGGAVEIFAEAAQANPTLYADLTNPQTLSKYQYCINNPLRYTDPSGHQQQGDENPITRWIGSLIRTLLSQKDQYPTEPERRGPLSLSEDKVNAQVTQRAGEQARITADIVKATGLDLGALQLLEDTVNNKSGSAAVSSVIFVANAVTLGKGGNLREGAVVIGENMAERVVPTAEAIGAKVYKPLAEVTVDSCARFVSRAVSSGKRVFDVGIEGNVARSEFYAAESARLGRMGFRRVERGTLELRGRTLKLYEWVKARR